MAKKAVSGKAKTPHVGESDAGGLFDGAAQSDAMEQHTARWLKMVLQHSNDGINVVEFFKEGARRKLLLCNDRYVEMSGRSRKELFAADNLNDFTIDLIEAPSQTDYYQAILRGRKFTGMSSWRRPDGKENWYDWTASPVHIGKKIYIFGIDRDVTEKRKSLEALRNSESVAHVLLNASRDRLFLISPDGAILAANEMAAKAWNISPDKLIGRNCFAMVSRTQGKVRREFVNRVATTGVPADMEDSRDGRLLHSSAYPIFDLAGKVTSLAIFVQDITDLRESQKILQESEQRFRELFENAPICIFEEDLSCNPLAIRQANRLARQTYGWSQEEFAKLNVDRLVPPESYQDMLKVGDSLRRNKSITIESFNRRRDGTVFPVRIHATNLPSADIRHAIVMVEDITELKRVAESLRRSEERYRGLVESQSELIVRVDTHNRFTFVNDAYCKTMGKSRQKLIGRVFMPLVHPDDIKPTLAAMQNLYKHPYRCNVEQRALTANGWRWIDWEDHAILDDAGKVAEIQAVGRDITARKKAEESLNRRQHAEQHLRRQLVRLHEVGNKLSKAESFDELCRMAVELGRSHLGYDRIGLWFVEPNGEMLRGTYGTDENGNTRDERSIIAPISVTRPMQDVICMKKRLSIQQEIELRNHRAKVVGRGAQVVAALWNGEKVIGAMAMDNLLHRKPITAPDCEILKLFASDLAHLCGLKRAEEKVRESEARYRAVVEDQTELICRFLSDGTLTFVNQAYCNCFGIKRQDIIGKSFLSLIPEKYRRRIKSAIASPDRNNPVETMEQRVLARGQVRWQQWTHRAIFDKDGKFVEYQSAGRDITDRKMAEETLQALHIQLMNAQEVERRRLARDMHDSLGQQMIAMSYNIRDIGNQIPNAAIYLNRLSDDCQRMIREVREISHDLYPATLESLGLATSLRQLAAECKSDTKIMVRTSPKKFQLRYGTTVEIALFRIAQEAIHNCLRHSGAKQVVVSLAHNNRGLRLSVQDDGCGFDMSKTSTGFGLNTMKERARAVGGKLIIVSSPGKTHITVDVPLTPDNQANIAGKNVSKLQT